MNSDVSISCLYRSEGVSILSSFPKLIAVAMVLVRTVDNGSIE